MDARLMAWARAVKRRRRGRFPTLWLFTDAVKMPDPLPSIARLPAGLGGVVFRHDAVPGRAELARRVALLCKARRLALVVAGDARLAARVKAGVHLRGGRRGGVAGRARGIVTSSAHDVPDVARARRAGADIVFISPAFSTASHPGQPALGAARWARLARAAGDVDAYALGGVNGQTVKALATFCAGAGAIHALDRRNSL